MDKSVYTGKQMICPCPALLITCGNPQEKNENIITISWAGILSSNPEYVSISVRPIRRSFELIKRYMQFVINVPGDGLVKEVDYCGSYSGREVDKFSKCCFTKFYVAETNTPLLSECFLHLICQVEHILDLGAHHLFIARVVKKYADADLAPAQQPLCYVRPDYHRLEAGPIWSFGQSRRGKAVD